MISGWRPSLLALLDEVVLEDLHAPGLEVVASVEVAAEEGASKELRGGRAPITYGILTLCDVLFQGT